MTEGGGQQFREESIEAEVASVSDPAQETNPGDIQIEGTPNEASQDGAEQGAPGADGAVETPEVGAPVAEPLDKAATITSLQEKNLVNADQAQLLQATSEKKAQLIAQYLEKEYYTAEDIELLMEMSDEDLESQLEYTDKENLLKNASVDQMIRDGVFNEEDREGLLALKLEDLQEWLANWNDNPEVAKNLAEIQRQKDALPALYKTDDEGNLKLKGEGIIDQDWLREQADKEVARQELAFLGSGGKLDRAIGGLLRPGIYDSVRAKYDAQYTDEAEQEYEKVRSMSQEDLLQTIYINEENQMLSKEEFIEVYKRNAFMRNADEVQQAYDAAIAEAMKTGLRKEVDELRGKSGVSVSEAEDSLPDESDPEQAEEVKELKRTLLEEMIRFGMFAKDQLITAGSEAFDNLLSNTDLMAIFRAFIHGGAAFDAGRGGRLGYEDGKMVRYVEEAELLAKFKKPQELGQALALAITRNKEMQAMKFTVGDELLQQAAEGDPAAVRQVMQEVVDHLHGGSNTDERWKALRKGLAEGLYPGSNGLLDDDIQELFMENKGAEVLRLLDLMMPKEGAGSSSKDDKNQQPANVTPISAAGGSSGQGDAASPATQNPKAA